MAEPSISVMINLGSDAAPNWATITSDKALYWSGEGADASNVKPVTRKLFNVWVPTLWIGNTPTYGSGTQITAYTIPTAATQYAKILKITLLSGALTDKIELTAYDDTFHTSASTELFIGRAAVDNTSWLKAIPSGGSFAVSSPSTPSVDWCTFNTSVAVADNIANQLQGDNSYIRWSVIPATIGHGLYAVLAHAVPSDASAGWHTPVITVRYKWID